MSSTRHPLLTTAARRYFYSGWAFLIPYLAAYLLYYVTGWPVNPTESAAEGASTSSLNPLPPYTSYSLIPSLLYIYWALHAIHLLLAGAALWSWFQDRRAAASLSAASPYSLPATRYSLLTALAPWALLALIFYIPGAYLEWPSDPWEHLRRINEWNGLDTVGAHSTWKKSAYFIPYSLLGWCVGLPQLLWLDFYYTGICVLLCWQYYRFSRACGLNARASTVFVIIQALFFGNNIFSFYRYYGISSSIYAQLGAVALTRIMLEVLGTMREKDRSTLASTRYSLLRPIGAGLILSPLIALNHFQGMVIAGLSVLAVVTWRLIEWKRWMGGLLALVAILTSVAVILWFPRDPAIYETHRHHGWLTAWYGFNLLSAVSPAFDRSLQILGGLGVLNIIVALWLLRRNHVVGWLIVMPPLALLLPGFAIPLVQALVSHGGMENILAFHRMLLAIPMGLAIVTGLAIQGADRVAGEQNAPTISNQIIGRLRARLQVRHLPFSVILFFLTLVSFESLSHHRLWQGLNVPPKDLQLQSLIRYSTLHAPSQSGNVDEDILKITTQLEIDVRETFLPVRFSYISRQSPTKWDDRQLEQRVDWLASMQASVAWTQRDLNSTQAPCFLHDLPIKVAATGRIRVVAQPTAIEADWLVFGGLPPGKTFGRGQLLLINPPDAATEIFSPQLIPISRNKRYRLSSAIRQIGDATSTNYLAVAWFDRSGKLLQSNVSSPDGANEPIGWSNGTYSYYGLFGQPAPREKKRYSISFGLGETAAIPGNAAFIRVGALLNYRSTPQIAVELSDVILEEKSLQSRMRFDVPDFRQLSSAASQAGLLSGHWSAQHVPVAQAGARDLNASSARLIAPR